MNFGGHNIQSIPRARTQNQVLNLDLKVTLILAIPAASITSMHWVPPELVYVFHSFNKYSLGTLCAGKVYALKYIHLNLLSP